MLDVVKPDDLQAIIVRLVLAAQQGDVAAARLVLAYTLGKPGPIVDPDLLDLHEWALWQQMPVSNEALTPLLGPLIVPLACTLVRTFLPLMQNTIAGQLAQHLDPAAPAPGTDQTQPKSACPPDEAGAVPVAEPASAASRAAPASPCPQAAAVEGAMRQTAPASTAGQSSRKDSRDKREPARKPQGPAELARKLVSGLTGGQKSEEAAGPDGELQRLLEVCAQLLGSAAAAREGAGVLGFPCSPPARMQT
jgi:hypothetical protein